MGNGEEDPVRQRQRFRLLQARFEDDPVQQEELRSFASRLEVSPEDIFTHDLITKETTVEIITEGVDAVLVGGSGHFSVYGDAPWLPSFFATLGELVDRQFPTFASCFGYQGMVTALGGRVCLDEANTEVGTFWLERTAECQGDPLFGHLPDRFLAQCGHKDRAVELPAGFTNLMRSERCEFQAFRIGNGFVYAAQFHPELTGAENRARFTRYLDVYAKVFGKARAHQMLEGFAESPETTDLLKRFANLIADETP
jgi:GMP synthase (glutamine-hydrolysing)